MIRSQLLVPWVFALLVLGCTAKNVTATIEGEPVCPDFELGAAHTKMKGGLLRPVRVSVLEDQDDDDPISSRTLLGRRTADSPSPPLVVRDANEPVWVSWAQCENEFAPRPVKAERRGVSQVAAYQCGEAKVYKQVELKVRKGDPSSRIVKFVAPPEPACWSDSVPTTGEPDAGADAGDAAADESADAGDAAVPADAAATATAQAAPAAPGAPKGASPPAESPTPAPGKAP